MVMREEVISTEKGLLVLKMIKDSITGAKTDLVEAVKEKI